MTPLPFLFCFQVAHHAPPGEGFIGKMTHFSYQERYILEFCQIWTLKPLNILIYSYNLIQCHRYVIIFHIFPSKSSHKIPVWELPKGSKRLGHWSHLGLHIHPLIVDPQPNFKGPKICRKMGSFKYLTCQICQKHPENEESLLQSWDCFYVALKDRFFMCSCWFQIRKIIRQ